MTTKTPYVWTLAELVPSHIGDSHLADVLATAGRTGAEGERMRKPYAEVPDADESAAGERHQRHHGPDRSKDLASHSGRRTGCGETGGHA